MTVWGVLGRIQQRILITSSAAVIVAGGAFLTYAAVVSTEGALPLGSKSTPASLTVLSPNVPAEVQALEASTAPSLFDRDTVTQHVAYAASTVEATLDATLPVTAIKVYGAAPYLLTVKAESGGGVYGPIAGFENLNLTRLPSGWTTFTASAPVTTGKLQFELTPATGGTATGLRELEVWTATNPANVKSGRALLEGLLGSNPPPQGRLYNAYNLTANPTVGVIAVSGDDTADNTFRFALERDPAQFVRAYLAYELYGQEHWVSPLRKINSIMSNGGGALLLPNGVWTTQVERINPAWFKQGTNTIEFGVLSSSYKDAGYTVRNVRVIAELDTGANVIDALSASQPDATGTNPLEALHDGDLTTGWKPYPADQPINAVAPSVEFAFARPTQMEAVSFDLSAPIEGELKVSAQFLNPLTGTLTWVDFPTEQGTVKSGWNTIYVPAEVPLGARVVNAVRLSFLGGSPSNAEVREFLFVGSPVGNRASAPKVVVTYPENGEFYGRSAFIQGFVEPWDNGSGRAEITIGGRSQIHYAGDVSNWISKDTAGFTSQADSDPWSVEVKAVYPNGQTVSTIVQLTDQRLPAAPIGGTIAGSTSTVVSPKGKKTISHDESKLVFDGGTVSADTTVTVQPLAETDVPALDVGMVNVTKGPRRGYRFLPHGAKFLKNVNLTLPYDKALVPPGHTEDDIKTYYFDEQAGRWVALERVAVDKSGKLVNSVTNHFTDMINAVVTVPDHPEAVSFNPTSMKDIKAADPGSQVNLIEPPKANNTGDARLSYPIEVPPGRNGLQPQLAVSYNSSGGNGWMGMGWDLPAESISIDTRWGVPRYHATLETETYTLNGEQMTPVAHRGALQARTTEKTFHTRVEGQFRKIVRHGSSPSTYWWEVTDKNGVRYVYGGNLTTKTRDAAAVLAHPTKGNVFKWMLREVRDLDGNTIRYHYDIVSGGDGQSSPRWRQAYPSKITYTGTDGGDGPYEVVFNRSGGRTDVTSDARGGFKTVLDQRLTGIDVRLTTETNPLIRRYVFGYREGAFAKTLLTSVTQYGTDADLPGAKAFNTHTFEYYDDIRNADGTYKGFGTPILVKTGTDNLAYKTRGGSFPHTVLGGTEGQSQGFDGYFGVGLPVGTKNINVGVNFGASRGKSRGSNTFVDVDGDGLPDKVFLTNQGYYRPNLTASGALDDVRFFTTGSPKTVANFGRPSETESQTTNLGVNAFVVGLTGNGGLAQTNTRDMSYLTDVNGDGLVDLVNRGSVRFNTAKSTGIAGFSANSYDTEVPLGDVGGGVSQDVLPDVSGDKARLEVENPLMDNVRRWVAPYDGTVRVSGGVRLVNIATDPRFTPEEKEERANYKQADGVRVSIQKNSNVPLWNIPIPAADYDEHVPTGVDAIPVKKGDRLHFRVQSVYDGVYDRVAWSPTVEYVSGGSALTAIDANNLNAYHYQAGEDFVHAGRPVEMSVPYRGTMRLSGLLTKTATTTDDILLRVSVIDRVLDANGNLVSKTVTTPVEKKLAWDYVGPVTLQEDFAVGRYNGVKVEFVIDSPIDLALLKWGEPGSSEIPRPGHPQLYYTEAYQEEEQPLAPETISTDGDTPTHGDQVKPNGKGNMQPIPDEDGNPIVIPAKQLDVYDADGKPILVVPAKYDADIYPANHLTAPQQAWIAPRDGVILWTPWVKLKDGSAEIPPITVPDGSVTLTAKRGGVRLAKKEVLIQNNQVVESSQGYYGVQAFRVSAGDAIFFDATTRNPAIESRLSATFVAIHYAGETAWQVPITDTVGLLAHITGSAPMADPNAPEPVDGRAVFVVRRGDSEILASQVVDFAATPSVDLSFSRAVTQDEKLYFEVFTITSGVSVQTNQAWARYSSDSSWKATGSGTVTLAPVLHFRSGVPDGSVTLTAHRDNAVAAQQTYQVSNGQVVGAPLSVDVAGNQVLTFAYSTADYPLSSYLEDKGAVEVDDDGSKTTVGSASFTIGMPTRFGYQAAQDATHHFPLNDLLFGNPYRGWATAAYNGNGARATAAINESLFVMSTNPEDYKSSTTQHNAWFAYGAADVDRWLSQDDFWWTSPAEVSASRKGIDNIYDPRQDDFSDPPKSGGFAGAVRPPKMSTSTQKTMGFGFVLSMTQSDGDTTSQLDLIDMNGDRFPDIVGQGSTQYTWADGKFFDAYGGGPARTSEDEQTTIGFSVGVPTSRAGAIGQILQLGDRDNGEKSSVSIGASVNEGSNKTNTDLIDVNGDGLPDRVSPGLTVQLNNGYGFEPAETWAGGQLTQGTSKGKAGNVGFSMWNGVFGGGVSVSENHNYTNTTLMDINGDGLNDVVTVGGMNRLAVMLNTGAGFIGPIDWPGALRPYKDLKSKAPGPMAVADGASTSASGSLKFGFGFNIAFINISFSVGGNMGETASQPSISYTDLNGDGFVDSVLTADDSEMTVVLNPIQRTNMLRKVHRPLGATFELEYTRSGNTYDMPQSRYVMSRVKVFDGHVGEGADTQVSTYQYQAPKYNRLERDFYGYGTVIETHLNTLDADKPYRAVTREFHNENFYAKGLLKRETLKTAAGQVLSETENSYVLHDVDTNTAPADPFSTTATVFPKLTRTDKRFFEPRTPGASMSTYTEHEYDVFGNVTRFIDAGDEGTTDDVDAAITYTNCPTYVIQPQTINVQGGGVPMRRREADIDCPSGNLKQVRQYLADGTASVTDLGYFANGNLEYVVGPANKTGQRYRLTYAYDKVVGVHVTSITDSFQLSSTATHNYKFGKVETTTDTNGNQTTYVYDTVGRVENIYGPYEQGQSQATLSFRYATVETPTSDGNGATQPLATVPWALTRHVDKDATGAYKASGTIDTLLFTDGLKRVLQTKKDATILADGASTAVDRMTVSGQVVFDAFGRTTDQYYPVTEDKNEALNLVYNPIPDDQAGPTRTVYDERDRVESTTLPDGSLTTIQYRFGAGRSGTGIQFETEVRDANVNVQANGSTKYTYRDVRDLITSVKELTEGGDIWTSYTYDALKQIVEVKDDQGNLTKVSYDHLGRRTAIDNPDTGLTEYAFDPASNLTRKVTANLRAQTKELTYDYDFNRLKSVVFPVNTDLSVSYAYGLPGAANNTAGRITRVVSRRTTTSQGVKEDSEERHYGKLGEVTYEKKTVVTFSDPLHPSVFETRYKYDTFGRLLELTYPDGELLTNVYDSGGNLKYAEGVKRVDSTGQNHRYRYLLALHYDKFEQRVLMEQGNGVKTAYSYDAQTRRLHGLTAGKSNGTQFQNLEYSYDRVGNVLSLKNLTDMPLANVYGGPAYQRYEYDRLYRLTRAQGVFPYNKTGAEPDATSCNGSQNTHCRVYAMDMVYDTIHNIRSKTQTDKRYPPGGASAIDQKKTSYNWTYDYNPSGPSSTRPHAPTHIGGLTYQYDANGNQLGWTNDQNGTQRTIVWDEENRILSLFDNGHEKTYKYDDQGTRTIKRGPQGETVYVNQFYTQRPGATGTKHVYAGTSRIASKLLRQDVPGANPAGKTPYEKDIYFYHPDHLGSSSYVTDLNARIYEHLEYFPFGEGWIEENSNVQRTPYHFTAKELDEETGLYYYGARYYDPRTSVWQSADPIDRFNAQSPTIGLNLYQYGLLNPVRLTDPDGRLEYDPASETFSIQKRDTLSSISKETGASISELMAANPGIKDKNKIYAGNAINIPEKDNIQAFKWAASQLGSTDYSVAASIDNFASGTNKCNLFCSHAYEKGAGAEFPRHYAFGLLKRSGPATAGELATSSLPGTELLDLSRGRIGDTIAWKKNYSDATGHSAIFSGQVDIRGQTRPAGEWGTIGASSDMVRYREQSYLEKQYPGITPGVRRIGQ